jgi:hypothetical protein
MTRALKLHKTSRRHISNWIPIHVKKTLNVREGVQKDRRDMSLTIVHMKEEGLDYGIVRAPLTPFIFIIPHSKLVPNLSH